MYICCGWMVFLTKGSLEKHLRSSAHDKGIPCKICRACFVKQNMLDQHYKAGYHLIPARPPARVCCFPCVLDFADQSEFDRHFSDRHRQPPPPIMQIPLPQLALPAPPPTIRRIPVPPPPQPVSTVSTPTLQPQQFQSVLHSVPNHSSTQRELDIHIDSRVRFKWRCNQCGTACYSEQRLDIHRIASHPRPQDSAAPERQAAETPASTAQSLLPHRSDGHHCEHCPAVIDRESLEQHVRRFHTNVPVQDPPRPPKPAPPTDLLARFPPKPAPPAALLARFQCDSCTLDFADQLELDAHLSTSLRHNFACQQCTVVVASKLLLREHIRFCHAERPTQVPVLNEVARPRPTPAPLATFHCAPCARDFGDQLELDAHLTTSLRHNLSCEQCTAVVATDLLLREHVRRVHTKPPVQVPVSNEAPRQPPTPASPTVPLARFRCAHCPRDFRTEFQLDVHLISLRHNFSCEPRTAVVVNGSVVREPVHTKPPVQVPVSNEAPRQEPTPAPPTVPLARFQCAPCARDFGDQLELDAHLTTSWRHKPSSESDPVSNTQSSEQPHMMPRAHGQPPVSSPVVDDAPAQQLPRTSPPADVEIAVEPPVQPARELIVNQDSAQPSSAPQPPRTDPFEHYPSRVPQTTARHLFPCAPCTRNFKDQRALDSHLASQAHNIICRLCHEHCGDRSSLRAHLVLHHGARAPAPQFHCIPCDRGFTNQASFDCHVDSGLHRLQLGCDICTGLFSTRMVLDRHRDIAHPGAAAWAPDPVVAELVPRVKCGLCGRTFIARYALDQHLRSNAHVDKRGKGNRGRV